MGPLGPRSWEDEPRARAPITRLLDRVGRAWHGYEVHGAEHIPLDRPALVVFYHGFMPLDAWYFTGWFYQRTGRVIRGLGDRWLFKTPGLAWLVRTMGADVGTRDNALKWLANGELVGVSPGGVREAIQGRPNHYRVSWGERRGFAEVATEAKVPVIPAFTQNVEELYRSPLVWTRPFQAAYERTRWPIVPIVGLGPLPWPVKLHTWIGSPIPFVPGRSPEALRAETRAAIEALIAAHQPGRPRILRGLAARLREASAPKREEPDQRR